MAKDMDGNKLTVGQHVGFKADTETYGKVVGINGSTVKVAVYDSNTGEESIEHVDADRCWSE